MYLEKTENKVTPRTIFRQLTNDEEEVETLSSSGTESNSLFTQTKRKGLILILSSRK